MGLAMFAAQRMLLVGEVLIHLLMFAGLGAVGLHVLLVSLQAGLVHLLELVDGQLKVGDEGVAARAGEILADDDAHELHVFGMRGHGVGGDDPAALTELMGDGELVEGMFVFRVQTECDEGQTGATGLGHEDEAHLLHGRGEVIGGAGQVQHDAAVALLAEADELVVLADDLAGATGEVEGEGGLISAEVVDVEDEF